MEEQEEVGMNSKGIEEGGSRKKPKGIAKGRKRKEERWRNGEEKDRKNRKE